MCEDEACLSDWKKGAQCSNADSMIISFVILSDSEESVKHK